MKGKKILIGGVAGTGKTTLAKMLMKELGITHHLNLGWILSAARAYNSKETCPELFDYSFRPLNGCDPFKTFYDQAIKVKPAIEECLKRAKQDGTSMIIEGVNILPRTINKNLYDHCFFLKAAENTEAHKKMLYANTHPDRQLTDKDFDNIKHIEYDLIEICKREYEWVINHSDNEKRVSEIIKIMNNCK